MNIKDSFIMLVLSFFPFNVLSQNFFQGVVSSTDGTPIMGAKIVDNNSGVSTYSDMFGKFILNTQLPPKIITVYSRGYKTVRRNAENNVNVIMSTPKEKHDVCQFFIGPQVSLFSNTAPFDIYHMSYGLRVGLVKKAGVYFCWMDNSFLYADNEHAIRNSGKQLYSTERFRINSKSYTAGLLFKLGGPISLYLGGGKSDYSVANRVSGGEYITTYKSISYPVEAGFMIRSRHLFLNAGVHNFDIVPIISELSELSQTTGDSNSFSDFEFGVINCGVGILF